VDIWVRNANDNVAPANYATHANTVHQDPIPEQSNWVYVRFQNIGKSPSYRFFVRVYLAHWPRTEFAYPDDFIPSVRPGGSPPSSLTRGTYLIGEAKVDSLDGLAEGQIAVEWPAALVPPRTLSIAGINVAWHPCLLVEVTPHDGFTPPGTHVWQNNNLAQKNISSSYYSATGDFAFAGLAGNLTSWSKFIVFQIQVKGPIPRSTPIYIRFLNKRVERYLVDEIERTKRRDVKPEQNEDTTAFRLIGKRSVKLVVPNVGLLPFIVEGNVRELPKNSTARVEVAQFDDSGWLSGGLIFEVKGPLE
jgi:hypothetical protein